MTTTKPAEPDWNTVIDDILRVMKEDSEDEPIGFDEHYFTQHSKDISNIEAFDWSTEWIKERPALLAWLEQKYEWWWEDQLYDDDGFQNWLNGYEIKVRGDAYLDGLQKKLIALYRERITEVWTCSTCGKEISEKHPYGHPNSIVRLGHPDPDVYPDGKVPEGTPTDEIQWKRVLYCDPCWRRDTLKEK